LEFVALCVIEREFLSIEVKQAVDLLCLGGERITFEVTFCHLALRGTSSVKDAGISVIALIRTASVYQSTNLQFFFTILVGSV